MTFTEADLTLGFSGITGPALTGGTITAVTARTFAYEVFYRGSVVDRGYDGVTEISGFSVAATDLNGVLRNVDQNALNFVLTGPVNYVGSDAQNGVPSTMYGGAFNDILVGGTGADNLLGEDGNDFLFAAPLVGGLVDPSVVSRNSLIGGLGQDSLWGGAGDDVIVGDLTNDFSGSAFPPNFTNCEDVIVGGLGADSIRGGFGNDLIFGGGFAADGSFALGDGADTIRGDQNNDAIWGMDGDDTIGGDQGDDVLLGGAGADTINGGQDNDNIFGEAGDDKLTGGAGFDYMTGGAGRDTFTFNLTDGYDAILDFDPTQDVLRVLGINADFVRTTMTGGIVNGVKYTIFGEWTATLSYQLQINGVLPSEFNTTNLIFT